MKIGNVEIKGKVVLGPMAGFTNLPYRRMAKEFNASLVYAEMVSDKAICFRNETTLKMLDISKDEHPVAMQLFGYDKESMVEAAKYIDEHCDCDIIDINMGCPVNKVIKAKGGSYWLLEPEHSYEVVKAIVESVKKPVTCKIRIGYDKNSINCVEYAKLMEKAGVKAIAVHGRYRSQMYEGKADYSYIKKVKEAVSIPVIGNGDVNSPLDAKRMLEETNCDLVMISRGSLGNPYVFKRVDEYLENGNLIEDLDVYQKVDLCKRYARELISYYGNELIAMKEMRTHACYYIKGLRNANRFKMFLVKMETYADLERILNEFLKSLDE